MEVVGLDVGCSCFEKQIRIETVKPHHSARVRTNSIEVVWKLKTHWGEEDARSAVMEV